MIITFKLLALAKILLTLQNPVATIPPALTISNSAFCPQNVFVGFI
jgi:hypothetical protein